MIENFAVSLFDDMALLEPSNSLGLSYLVLPNVTISHFLRTVM